MKLTIILLLFSLNIGTALSQSNPTYFRVKKRPGKVTLTPHSNGDIVMLRVSGLFRNARKVVYVDTINSYQAVVPKFARMQETNNLYNFCNTIPRENGRDNAICINSAPKEEYGTLEDFKKHIIEDPDYRGENPKNWLWGESSTLISFEKEIFNSYEAYKTLVEVNDRRNLCLFIILETSKSYLWINYVADVDTYDSDLMNFAQFLKKFKVLD